MLILWTLSTNTLKYLVRGWVKTGHFRGIFDPGLDHLPEGYLAVPRALTTNSLIYRSRYWPRTGYLEGQIYPYFDPFWAYFGPILGLFWADLRPILRDLGSK